MRDRGGVSWPGGEKTGGDNSIGEFSERGLGSDGASDGGLGLPASLSLCEGAGLLALRHAHCVSPETLELMTGSDSGLDSGLDEHSFIRLSNSRDSSSAVAKEAFRSLLNIWNSTLLL